MGLMTSKQWQVSPLHLLPPILVDRLTAASVSDGFSLQPIIHACLQAKQVHHIVICAPLLDEHVAAQICSH